MAELEKDAQTQSGQVEGRSEALSSIEQQKGHYQKNSTESSIFVDWLCMPYSPYYGHYYCYHHDPFLSAWMISDIFRHGGHHHGGGHGGHSDGCCDCKCGDGCGEFLGLLVLAVIVFIVIVALEYLLLL